MTNKKSSLIRVIIAILIISIALLATVFGLFLYNKNLGEDEYCQSLRQQKNISMDYSCKVGNEFTKDGTTYIYITIERPNAKFVDSSMYTMEKDNKKITNTAYAG